MIPPLRRQNKETCMRRLVFPLDFFNPGGVTCYVDGAEGAVAATWLEGEEVALGDVALAKVHQSFTVSANPPRSIKTVAGQSINNDVDTAAVRCRRCQWRMQSFATRRCARSARATDRPRLTVRLQSRQWRISITSSLVSAPLRHPLT